MCRILIYIVDSDMLESVQEAFDTLQSVTCVSFTKKTDYDLDYLSIEPGSQYA